MSLNFAMRFCELQFQGNYQIRIVVGTNLPVVMLRRGQAEIDVAH